MQSHLWAPWRMEFIKGKDPAGCIFCTLPKQDRDKENLILHRASDAFVILNRFPYNNGHLMIVPNDHIANYCDVPDSVLTQMNQLMKQGIKALDKRYQPQGYNVGMNLGEAAGAGIKGHLHMHIVPRWQGDTNFMPVLSETKCLPHHLESSFNDLKAALEGEFSR